MKRCRGRIQEEAGWKGRKGEFGAAREERRKGTGRSQKGKGRACPGPPLWAREERVVGEKTDARARRPPIDFRAWPGSSPSSTQDKQAMQQGPIENQRGG